MDDLSLCLNPNGFNFHSSDENQEGVMDNLLEALKTGSAFNVGREKRDRKQRTPRAAGGRL